jgi:hypothetical protein
MLLNFQTQSRMVLDNKVGKFSRSAHSGTVELELKFQPKKKVNQKDTLELIAPNLNTKAMLLIKEFLNSSLLQWEWMLLDKRCF